MQATIEPSDIAGSIQAPASKSSMQRACAAALVFSRETLIRNPGHSNDDLSALELIKEMGSGVWKQADGSLQITSHGLNPRNGLVNCGESGLGIRMFAPILALSEKPITINGRGSLLSRPMDFFDTVFPRLGVEIHSENGRLPLRLKGPLQPVDLEIDGSLSSQFLTGLLMAYAAAGAENRVIRVRNLKSKPYIQLTLDVMNRFGRLVENRNFEEFYFPAGKPTNQPDQNHSYTVEGDWSGGAFLLAAGAIAGTIKVSGLDTGSSQADKAILEALQDCGARMTVWNHEIEIGPSELRSFSFDATDCPDLFPPLVSLAAYCTGISVIRGARRLTHKESNRALTLKEEFGKMGVDIRLDDDQMFVKGNKHIHGAKVHSNHDHRIAMACSIAALGARGKTTIDAADAINKSYPDFYDHLRYLGASVSLTNQLIN